MAKPLVAIVGRPNVGKSMLFNKLTGQRTSIVEDTPGVTRDRIYGECEWCGKKLTLIDTGGIEPKTDDIILSQMKFQAEIAVESADVIVFLCDDGSKYMMYHEQDCCESVRVNDICGDVTRLLNHPITKAECVTHSDDPEHPATDKWDDSWTWTFYHLATIKGYVTIRWYGTSNGYYSEYVDFVKLKYKEDNNG